MPATHNIILNTDSYKASHYLQYPPGTERISSYVEARGGTFPKTVFFGLQMYLQEYLCRPISAQDIDQAEAILRPHGLPFNRQGWEYILNTHGGYLPLAIEAVPEGTVVPVLNVLLQLINTDPKCYWLTNYVETSLLRAIWYPTVVATMSWHCKAIIRRYMQQTCDDLSGLEFKLHDFGARGVSSTESACIGGLAHLVNFQGTDTLSAIQAGQTYYDESMAGFSIPAAEHSTVTCWGRGSEAQAYANMLKQFSGPERLFAVVSDSYNLWGAIDDIWSQQLRQQVIDNGGTVIIRPDSGNPVEIVTKTIEKLMDNFGARTNSKGYKVLPDYLRVIQGDGVNLKTIEACLAAMQSKGQSADNIAFGMGGALLQKCDRDTCEFALKADAIEKNQQWHDVYKDPITGPSKRSKRGRLALISVNGHYQTIRRDDLGARKNQLLPIFRNGKMLQRSSLAQIRQRAAQAL